MFVGFALWRALLLPTATSPPANLEAATPVYATLRPLVGGPKFLPIHVQIAAHDEAYDFLPAEPTALSTTTTLLSGGAVDGLIRCRPVRTLGDRRVPWRIIGYTNRASEQLRTFAQGCESQLSLPTNNWCAPRLTAVVPLIVL